MTPPGWSTNDERVQDLRQLKAREQRELLLLAAGYSRQEIADLTSSSMTAINRRLTEGRAHLRRLGERRAHDARRSGGRAHPTPRIEQI